jgi:hypothetical protein
MPYSDSEILAGVLAVSCLLLLYCWFSKSARQEPLVGALNHIPGLRMRNGFTPGSGAYSRGSDVVSASMSRHSLPNSTTKLYGKRSGLVGDDAKVASMHELTTDQTPDPSKHKDVPSDMVDMRWAPDYTIGVDSRAATIEDMILGRTLDKSDATDPSIYRMCKTDKTNNSLSGDVLNLTDYSRDFDDPQLQYSHVVNTMSTVTN